MRTPLLHPPIPSDPTGPALRPRTARIAGFILLWSLCVSGLTSVGLAQAQDRIGIGSLGDAAIAVQPEANRAPAGLTSAPIPLPAGVTVGYAPNHWYATTWESDRPAWIKALLWALYSIVALICLYGVRHYLFTYNRLFGRQRHPYLPIDVADWPRLTVLIPCHNEERVVSSILESLLKADYPVDRMVISPVDDRSTDRTREIIDRYARAFPDRIRPMFRTDGKPGKAAALKDAIATVKDDVILVFDADYLPGRDLIKRLAAPFLDPQVGAVMGRVVPVNTPRNLLTRLLDLERAGGYQVDQQARMNLHVIAQYGGTVGGVRVSALEAVGGWREDSLAEDTDITFRLVLGGWKIAYSNRYECYEEVPETWPVRIRQIMRWARGHTDAAVRYMPGLATRSRLRLRERVDGAFLLFTYMMSPILLVGWFMAILAFYLGANPFLGAVAILSVAAYNTIGNFAAFFEIGAAAHLDGTERRIRILPLVLGGFLVSLVSTSRAVVGQLWPGKRELHWDKTERYREHPAMIATPHRPEPAADREPLARRSHPAQAPVAFAPAQAPMGGLASDPAFATSSVTAPARAASSESIPAPEQAPAPAFAPPPEHRPRTAADRHRPAPKDRPPIPQAEERIQVSPVKDARSGLNPEATP